MANTTEIKADALPDLDDLLQCPVCYEIPTGQIFQCNEGHHVCGRCKARLDQCPVCRALFFGTRNYAMEELIANVRKLQAFKLGGKMTVTSGSGGSESTASADTSVAGATLDGSVEDEENDETQSTQARAPAACKGLFRCLCCKSGDSERLPAARLLNHLRYFHAPDLIEGKSESGEYVQAWQIATVPGRIVISVRVSDMGVFFLVFEISKESIYAWVSMAAAPWVAHEFCYTVTISGNDREAIFTDCVWSVRSCEGALKKRGRCLVVTGADVRALTASANVSGRLALRRAPPDQLANTTQPRAVLRVASRGTEPPSLPSHPAVAPPPPQRAARLEPFLQDLQNDVARLSRAFETLGREADALARSEAQVRARINARADNLRNNPPTDNAPADNVRNNATDNRANNNAVENGNEALIEGVALGAHLSRNARRRMRLRLRAALNADTPPVAAPRPAPQSSAPRYDSPLSFSPRYSPLSAGPRPAPLSAAPRSAPPVSVSRAAPVSAPRAAPQHNGQATPSEQARRTAMSGPPMPPPPVPPGPSAAGTPQDQQRTNKKKRRHRR